jgi:hypothetical protein
MVTFPKLEVIPTDADGAELAAAEAFVCTVPIVLVLGRVMKGFNEDERLELWPGLGGWVP